MLPLPHLIPQSYYINYAHSTDEDAERLPLESGIVGGFFHFFILFFMFSIILPQEVGGRVLKEKSKNIPEAQMNLI